MASLRIGKLIASLACRENEGGCGKSIAVIKDPPKGARGPRLNKMVAIHSDERAAEHVTPASITTAVVYKLRHALEERCASRREG